MNKIFLVCINILIASISKAQFYMGVQSSYNIAVQGRTLGDFLLIDGSFSNTTNDNVFKDKRSSFGGGLKFGAIIGYQVNQYIGIELNSNFHKTNQVSTKATEGNNTTNMSLNGNIISLNPALVGYFFNGNPKIYSKLGIVYNSGKFIYNYNLKTASNQESYSYNLNKGSALGLSFSFGADWKLKQRISIRTELCYISANYYPKKANLEKYEENGQNQMPSINPKDYEITYSKSGNSDGEYYGSALGEGTLVRPQIPMNGLGLNVGVIYLFRKK